MSLPGRGVNEVGPMSPNTEFFFDGISNLLLKIMRFVNPEDIKFPIVRITKVKPVFFFFCFDLI